MEALFEPIVVLTGASVDQVKLITCLVISYPLGNIYVRLPPYWKHYFSVFISMFFMIPMLGLHRGFLEVLGDIVATYYIASIWRGWKGMPWIVFGLIMSHLTFNHILRAFANIQYETIEITGPQMVLTMKLTTFAFNVLDGQTPIQDLDKWQQTKRITKYPSLIEFLGYSFYFPGFLVGPYLDYTQYTDLVHEGTLRDAAAKVKSQKKLPPGRKTAAYYKLFIGVSALALFVVFGGNYTFSAALKPDFVKHTIFYRILIFQVYGIVERCKYYAIWSLTEGASIVTGLGFSGFSPSSGQPQWTGAANVNIRNIELAPNFKVLLDSWNINTNIWLRECVYKRVTPKGKKPGFMSSMLTFGCSALWHGIAPGYYLCFITGGFITTLARLMRKHVRPLLLPHPSLPIDSQPNKTRNTLKFIYDTLGTIASVLCMNYCTGAFMVLSFHSTFVLWARLGFYGHVLTWGGLIFFYCGGLKGFIAFGVRRGWRKEEERKRLEGEGEGEGEEEEEEEETTFQVPPALDEVIPPPN